MTEEQNRIAEQDAIIKELVEALDLILPLAVGYVAVSDVGNNAKFIKSANDVLAKAKGQQ